MKTKIFLLFLVLGMGAMQMEAQGLFKQLKKTVKEVKQAKEGQEESFEDVSLETLLEGESSTSSTKSSQNTSQSPSQSSSEDEATLVVSADGATKDEATKVALRSAIEQAYGTFVSANTTILNDELVKDEIVTVTSGNIKRYNEISSNVMPDGKTFVTLQATVSISKLVSYAQSKGAETEFAGATFGMNMKMKELNKQNEKKALDNLLIQIKELTPYIFSWNLNVQEPKLAKNYMNLIWAPCSLDNNENENRRNLSLFFERKRGFDYLSAEEDFDLPQAIDYLCNYPNCYEMTFEIRTYPNENAKKLATLITSTLNSLAMSEEEREEYKKLGLPYSTLDLRQNGGWSLRASEDDMETFQLMFNRIISEAFGNFKIVDNLGVESYCYPFEIALYKLYQPYYYGNNWKHMNIKFPAIVFYDPHLRVTNFFIHGTGLFQYAKVLHQNNVLGEKYYPTFLDWIDSSVGGRHPDFTIKFFMPKAFHAL